MQTTDSCIATNRINVNRNININNINRGNGNNWVHNPTHRQGLRYNNADVANRFGGNRVDYDKLGLKFQTYHEWLGSGVRGSAATVVAH